MSQSNNWVIEGNMLAEPTLTTFASGNTKLEGAVMIHETSTNPKTGEVKKNDTKVYFEQWNEAAHATADLIGVGDLVRVSGRLFRDDWIDSNSMPRTTLRIKADSVTLKFKRRSVREYTPDDAPEVANPDEVSASV